MVVAQAQRIEVAGDRVTFTFSPTQRALLRHRSSRTARGSKRLAQQLAGRRIAVVGVQSDAGPAPSAAPEIRDAGCARPAPANAGDARKSTLREQALADAGVQALLEVFPAEIRDVEEM